MEEGKIPPEVQQRMIRFQQLQQSLQNITMSKQQLELELTEVEKALDELSRISDEAVVYKSVGSLLIQSDRTKLIDELNERKEILNLRLKALGRQEERFRGEIKELQEKLRKDLVGLGGTP